MNQHLSITKSNDRGTVAGLRVQFAYPEMGIAF